MQFSYNFQRKMLLNLTSVLIYSLVLGQLPPRKIAPNPKTNANPNPNRGVTFLRGDCPYTALHTVR